MAATTDSRFSVRQAVFITGLEEKSIDRFFFEANLRERGQAREFDESDLMFLEICREHQEDLTRKGRERIYQALRASASAVICVGALRVALNEVRRSLQDRIGTVRKARDAVVENPEVLGGEPVIRGTRIPARNVAVKLARGASPKELLKHFPSLDEEKIELARLWCDLNPKRGRPAERPWQT